MRFSPFAAAFLFSVIASAAFAAAPETAILAGGCFWSMESAFDDVPGVISATSGYAGGTVANPSYEQVSAGNTGHVEAVKVIFDPAKTSYEKLLGIYWHHADPLDAEGQFCDKGPEYRSEIFTTSDAQATQARASQQAVEQQLHQKTVTKIIPATNFYAAEEYHQRYTKKNPIQYGLYRTGCGRDARTAEIWKGASAQ